MTYNVWNKWDPLKAVLLGDCYGPEFFKDIKNSKIRSALQQIATETQEDLANYEKVLKDFGCKVFRPPLDKNDSIFNYIDPDGKILGAVPRSPLQPRDCQVVIGNSLFYTGHDHWSFKKVLDNYNPDFVYFKGPLDEKRFLAYKGDNAPGWPAYDDYLESFLSNKISSDSGVQMEFDNIHWIESRLPVFHIDAPSITVVGKDIYIDQTLEHQTKDKQFFKQYYFDKFQNSFDNFRINTVNIGGHNDSCFHTIKPGAILSLEKIQTYSESFPGWDVCYLPNQSWDRVSAFNKIKHKVSGKWWVPGQEDNDEFTNFVESWLTNWVGFVEETVFDVNVLVLDEHHVCVSQPDNKQVNDFLKKHKMEPVYVPWRHRYFWDGGLHCITLDLYREGEQQNYFPQRTNSINDRGFEC